MPFSKYFSLKDNGPCLLMIVLVTDLEKLSDYHEQFSVSLVYSLHNKVAKTGFSKLDEDLSLCTSKQ